MNKIMTNRLTVRELARMSGVSVRTLHYYDRIGLLPPAYLGENGYRYYERAQVLRLQQILFYRELGMPLVKIGRILDSADFDMSRALQEHRKHLTGEIARLHDLIHTIEKTLEEIEGAEMMENPFKGFSPEQQEAYEKELIDNGDEIVRNRVAEARANVKRMSKDQHDMVREEGHAVNLGMMVCLTENLPVTHERVQALVERHYKWVSNYWVPDGDAYEGLGRLYCDDEAFRNFYDRYDPRLAEYLSRAMGVYRRQHLN